MVNSLGVYELPQTFALVHSVWTSIAQIKCKMSAKQKSTISNIVDELKVNQEVYQKTLSELEFEKRDDTVGYVQQMKHLDFLLEQIV